MNHLPHLIESFIHFGLCPFEALLRQELSDLSLFFLFHDAVIANQSGSTDFRRWTIYGYEQWQALDSLRLVGGVNFDHLVFLNVRLVASGPTAAVFTEDNLRKTYGGRLAILDNAGQALSKQEWTL